MHDIINKSTYKCVNVEVESVRKVCNSTYYLFIGFLLIAIEGELAFYCAPTKLKQDNAM